jgi:hypothetical protein
MVTYLITSEEIRLNTPMGGNVDSDKFVNFINDVQVLVLENVLGTKLFNKIITDFNANNLTGLYLQMFTDYIKPVLWHSVFAEYVKIGSIIVGNGGMYKHVAENAEVASMEDMNYIAKNSQSKADTYIDRLIRFLVDKEASIVEYTTTQDNEYDIDPVNNLQTISGWYLSGTDSYLENRKKYADGGTDDCHNFNNNY